jgi:hypothetical protein
VQQYVARWMFTHDNSVFTSVFNSIFSYFRYIELNLVAYLLNPHYSYSDTSLFDDGTIIEGFVTCVETFYHADEDMPDQVVNKELRLFQNKEGCFAKKLVRTYQNFDFIPGNFMV